MTSRLFGVRVAHGVAPGRSVVVLAGVTAEGTQAAADFLTSAAGIEQIAHHVGTTAPNGVRLLPRYFEVVLRVEIAVGDVLRIQYITGRVIHPPS